MRDLFEYKKSKTYNFKIDTTKTFEEQELLEETKAILSNIFRDYLASDNQRIKILELEKKERIELEKEKKERYDPSNLFKKRETIITEKQDEIAIVEYKNDNIFKRIKNLIMKFLTQKNN